MGSGTVNGTSFSDPTVVAYLSEFMSETGDRVRVARDALIAGGTDPLPQCGTSTVEDGPAIVLSSLTATISDPATANPVTC